MPSANPPSISISSPIIISENAAGPSTHPRDRNRNSLLGVIPSSSESIHPCQRTRDRMHTKLRRLAFKSSLGVETGDVRR